MKLDRGRTEWIAALASLIIGVLLLVGCTSATASHSPVISSLTAESDVLLPSQTCEIACNVSRLDGESLSYQWSANRGSIFGEGPAVNWTAPDAAGTYTVTVSVSDDSGGLSISYLSIKVIANNPPTIDSLEVEEDEVTISEDCHIECVAADLDGGTLSYKWSASGGNISGEGSVITWTAPDAAGTYNITVTVSDGQGGEDTASRNIDVLAINDPPRVKGFRITDIIGNSVDKEEDIRIGKHYYIECIASDPDGDKLSYDWWVSEGAILGEDDAIDMLPDSMKSAYLPKIREGAMIPWKAPDDKPGHDGEVIFEVRVWDERGGEDSYAIQGHVFTSKCDSVL